MAIDGVNGNQNQVAKPQVKATTKARIARGLDAAGKMVLAQTLQYCLSGADKKDETKENETMTPNERKAWIKEYQEANGCSKKEAKAAFNQEFGKLDKMSHKEAKEWMKAKMEETGCSKKEAKAAFKEEFGYSAPLSNLTSLLRSVGLTHIGAIAATIDEATGGHLGLVKFVTGQGNNDAQYVRKNPEG